MILQYNVSSVSTEWGRFDGKFSSGSKVLSTCLTFSIIPIFSEDMRVILIRTQHLIWSDVWKAEHHKKGKQIRPKLPRNIQRMCLKVVQNSGSQAALVLRSFVPSHWACPKCWEVRIAEVWITGRWPYLGYPSVGHEATLYVEHAVLQSVAQSTTCTQIQQALKYTADVCEDFSQLASVEF